MRFLICLVLLCLCVTPGAHAWEKFYVLKPGQLKFQRTPAQQFSFFSAPSCRERISQIICQVPPQKSPDEVRKCLPESPSLATPIEKIYDILPEKVQKAFCGLDVIFVEDDLESLAYAAVVSHEDPNSPVTGAALGLRRVLLDIPYDATSVLGWKEQKAFGIKAPPFAHLPDGPRVEVVLPNSLSALHYILIHEIGHILDFSNLANKFECPKNETCNLQDWERSEIEKLVPSPCSYGALSWKNPLTPLDSQKFPLWEKLCFYSCKTALSAHEATDFYAQIDNTNFPTAYAASSPYEDFAESFTFHVLSLEGSWHYRVQTPLMAYILEKKWSMLDEKRAWLEEFYNRDLKYPTPSR